MSGELVANLNSDVLLIGGIASSLVNFRGKLIEALIAQGHQVSACSGEPHPRTIEQLREWGVKYYPIDLARRGLNVFSDLRYYQRLRGVIRQVRPHVVLSYTIKPVVYGSLAAKREKVPTVSAMITGAGAAQPGRSVGEKLVGAIARTLYARALSGVDPVFFQNPDDERLFADSGILKRSRAIQIAGSGVDTSWFAYAEPRVYPFTFLLIARLLVKKGVREYVSAAKELKRDYPNARFALVGPLEPGKGAITQAELQRWCDEQTIDYLGEVDDVRAALADSTVYVLPSFYGEGQPRTVLEAMATGRAIITTDSPGCRETVVDRENGLLVQPGDAADLARAMRQLLDSPELAVTYGRRSREIAEAKYDVAKVNAVILRELGLEN